ncbi:hypothetical protein [Rhodoferax ferrireducens]|nr:hypothetical protein [Rhodoferax ferrireducens]
MATAKKIGRPPGAKNATPSQLKERAKALLKEATLKERIKKLKAKE